MQDWVTDDPMHFIAVDEDRHAIARGRIHDVHDLRAAAVVQLLLRWNGKQS